MAHYGSMDSISEETMTSKEWNSLKKQPDKTKKMLSALHMSPAYLKVSWGDLDEGDQKKVSKWIAKNVSGWFEKSQPTSTPKGIKDVAPKHHKAAVKKKTSDVLRTPMKKEKSVCEVKKESIKEDWKQLYVEMGAKTEQDNQRRKELYLSTDPETIIVKPDSYRALDKLKTELNWKDNDYMEWKQYNTPQPLGSGHDYDGRYYIIPKVIDILRIKSLRIVKELPENAVLTFHKRGEIKEGMETEKSVRKVKKEKLTRRCTPKRTERVDKELSGGTIYQAIKCLDCERELGHTVFDPLAASYVNEEQKEAKDERYAIAFLRKNPIKLSDIDYYKGMAFKNRQNPHGIANAVWQDAWRKVGLAGEIMIIGSDETMYETPFSEDGIVVNRKYVKEKEEISRVKTDDFLSKRDTDPYNWDEQIHDIEPAFQRFKKGGRVSNYDRQRIYELYGVYRPSIFQDAKKQNLDAVERQEENERIKLEREL